MSINLTIPPEAICHGCSEPMKVVRWGGKARALGLKVPGREIATIECHDHVLTIEDVDVAQEIVKLLDAYHVSKETRASTVADDPAAPLNQAVDT